MSKKYKYIAHSGSVIVDVHSQRVFMDILKRLFIVPNRLQVAHGLNTRRIIRKGNYEELNAPYYYRN